MFELIGIVGIALSVAAYVPQAVHIAREHCAAGVSTRAWSMWLVSGALIGALAIHRGDVVFMLLQLTSLSSAILILFLARKYRGNVCDHHANTDLAPAGIISPPMPQP